MKNTDFAYAVTSVRAKENELLLPSFMEQLIVAGTYESAKRLLSEKGYRGFENTDDASVALKDSLKETYDFIEEISPSDGILNFLVIKNDFHNLKSVLKAAVLNDDQPEKYYIVPSVFSWVDFAQLIKSKKFEELPLILQVPAESGYELLTSTLDGQLLDVYLDRCSLEAMLTLADESGYEFFKKYAENFAAFSNVKVAIRCAQAAKSADFIESALCECALVDKEALAKAASRNIDEVLKLIENTDIAFLAKAFSISNTAFEKACDDELTAMLGSARYESFGPQPLVAYYCARETEIKTLRIIMSCKHIGIPPEKIKERVRVLYV